MGEEHTRINQSQHSRLPDTGEARNLPALGLNPGERYRISADLYIIERSLSVVNHELA